MAKFDIKKSKSLVFARFGGLSSVNQKGYTSKDRTFHTPPATRGFYCFVWPYYELFLVGGSWTSWPWKKGSKFKYLKDDNGEPITNKHPKFNEERGGKYWSVPTKNWNNHCDSIPDPWECELPQEEQDEIEKKADLKWETEHKDEAQWILVERPHPKTFKYDGEIWHHLGKNLKPCQILATKGSWVKSTAEDYRIALEKEMHIQRRAAMGEFGSGKKVEEPMRFMPSEKNPFRYGSKDHLECFVEKL